MNWYLKDIITVNMKMMTTLISKSINHAVTVWKKQDHIGLYSHWTFHLCAIQNKQHYTDKTEMLRKCYSSSS